MKLLLWRFGDCCVGGACSSSPKPLSSFVFCGADSATSSLYRRKSADRLCLYKSVCYTYIHVCTVPKKGDEIETAALLHSHPNSRASQSSYFLRVVMMSRIIASTVVSNIYTTYIAVGQKIRNLFTARYYFPGTEWAAGAMCGKLRRSVGQANIIECYQAFNM